MTKAYSRFITILFCGFIGGMFLLSLLLPDRERSETENRLLAQWPEFSWETLKSGEFTDGVEEYIADQFPLRDAWTGVKARVEQLIGKTEFNDVYLAGDTLISKVETPDSALVDKNFGYIQSMVGKTDAKVHLGLIPSAAEIWKDRLPAGAQNWDQTQLLEAFDKDGYLIYMKDLEDITPYLEQIREFAPRPYISNTKEFVRKLENWIEQN